jgi:malate dehydrogenase (oxaloacetate-decarboxylating)(NADP+)
VERVLHASEETALNPEPFDLVEGVIPLQSRILEASLHVAERLASYIFDQGLARARQVDAVRT